MTATALSEALSAALSEVETAALREVFVSDAQWLARFIEKRREEGALPEVLSSGEWPGEPEFTERFARLREAQYTLWSRSSHDSTAATLARLAPLLPFSGVRVEGLPSFFAGIAATQGEEKEQMEYKKAA